MLVYGAVMTSKTFSVSSFGKCAAVHQVYFSRSERKLPTCILEFSFNLAGWYFFFFISSCITIKSVVDVALQKYFVHFGRSLDFTLAVNANCLPTNGLLYVTLSAVAKSEKAQRTIAG